MPPATDHTSYLVWTSCLAGDALPLCRRPVLALNDRIVGLNKKAFFNITDERTLFELLVTSSNLSINSDDAYVVSRGFPHLPFTLPNSASTVMPIRLAASPATVLALRPGAYAILGIPKLVQMTLEMLGVLGLPRLHQLCIRKRHRMCMQCGQE